MNEPYSMVRDLSHEVRDSLSVIRSATSLLRLQDFGSDAARAATEKIDRGLDGALAAMDAFLLADQCERGTLSMALRQTSIAQILDQARDVSPLVAARIPSVAATPRLGAQADIARSALVVAAMVEQATSVLIPDTAIDLEVSLPPDGRPRVAVSFASSALERVGREWFEHYRGTRFGTRLSLRTARAVMRAQHGDLTTVIDGTRWQLVGTFAPADQRE
jgi:signal transduction histidine kinase